MYEVLDDSASVGLRAWAPTFEQMLGEASAGLVSVALEIRSVSPKQPYAIAAKGDDRESLMMNWLQEIVSYTGGKQVALTRFEVNPSDGFQATGVAWGEPIDARHGGKLTVKSVVDGVRVIHRPDCWMCEFYLEV